MKLPTRLNRTRTLGIALLAVTFLVGGLAGAAFLRVLSAQEEAATAPDPGGCRGKGGGKEAFLIDRLELSPEQRARVDGILERRREQTEAFWEREGGRLHLIVDSTRAEIRSVLSPAQQAEYDRLRAEHRVRKGRRTEEAR